MIRDQVSDERLLVVIDKSLHRVIEYYLTML